MTAATPGEIANATNAAHGAVAAGDAPWLMAMTLDKLVTTRVSVLCCADLTLDDALPAVFGLAIHY